MKRVLLAIIMAGSIAGVAHASEPAAPAFHATISNGACKFTVEVTNTTHTTGSIAVEYKAGAQGGDETFNAPEGITDKSFPLATVKGTVIVTGPPGQLAKRKVPVAGPNC